MINARAAPVANTLIINSQNNSLLPQMYEDMFIRNFFRQKVTAVDTINIAAAIIKYTVMPASFNLFYLTRFQI